MPCKPISTRNLAPLPDIEHLRKRMQQMATLAAVVGIEFGTPPYEFHPLWAKGEQMGAYKSGSGDELFVHFTSAGCFIKGFAHESKMSPYRTNPPTPWPGMFDDVPHHFASSLQEPAFDITATTFVVWRLAQDNEWMTGPVRSPKDSTDGSEDLLGQLIMPATEFAEWLSENYETEVDEDIVAAVFEHRPLTTDQLGALQPSANISALVRAVQKIGYPLA